MDGCEKVLEGGRATLPKTIEEATRRYMDVYKRNYVGSAAECYKLKGYAQAFIYQIRKVAPRFYEEKLPTLVNQAASTLLTCNTSTDEGARAFHLNHRWFLKMLEDFRVSQPAGEVNFQNERLRLEERDRLIQRQLALSKHIDDLEATEFDMEDLGEEDIDTIYAETFRKIDQLKAEQKQVNLAIAIIEGETIDEEATFELKVTRNSFLSKLSPEQLKDLESQLLQFYIDNNKRKNALYVDKSIIDTMVAKLNLDESKFSKAEIDLIAKDALEAYKSYYRDLESQRREEYFDSLLHNRNLHPKEGLILASPDDVPEDVKMKLDQYDQIGSRQREAILEQFRQMPCPDDTRGDAVEDVEVPNVIDDTPHIIEAIKQKGIQVARVKEEPRDDYDGTMGESSEIFVSGEIASSVVDNDMITYSDTNRTDPRGSMQMDLELPNGGCSALANSVDLSTGGAEAWHKLEVGQSNGNEGQAYDYEDDEDDEEENEDDDIECLGVIEPADKIKTVDVD